DVGLLLLHAAERFQPIGGEADVVARLPEHVSCGPAERIAVIHDQHFGCHRIPPDTASIVVVSTPAATHVRPGPACFLTRSARGQGRDTAAKQRGRGVPRLSGKTSAWKRSRSSAALPLTANGTTQI